MDSNEFVTQANQQRKQLLSFIVECLIVDTLGILSCQLSMEVLRLEMS